jgi:hypothetical protein
VLDDPAFSRTAAPSEALLAPELPRNSRVQRLSLDALLATLDAYAVDAVILPFDESYPATGFDRLTRYVREGGTLVDSAGRLFTMPRHVPPTAPGRATTPSGCPISGLASKRGGPTSRASRTDAGASHRARPSAGRAQQGFTPSALSRPAG